MKLSDYVIDFLVKEGIQHCFVVSGGAVIHLIDSAAQHPGMTPICSQHEQHSGAEADGYARVSQNLGLAMVTSGPGASNLTTSICNAYFDSIPAIFITGQVATFRLKPSKAIRQKGFQETDVVSIFKPITKYAVQIRNPLKVKYELQKALHLARSGRPGPVVIDFPDDLQRVEVNPEKLKGYQPPQKSASPVPTAKVSRVLQLLRNAKRPVLILGAGVRMARAQEAAIEFARQYGLPVVLTWGGMDLLEFSDLLNMGPVGVCGPRSGNFALQNADVILALGTRLSQMITGGKQNLFAVKAKKIMVDIDPLELTKFTKNDFKLDVALACDMKDFFKAAQKVRVKTSGDRLISWRNKIREWQQQYPICPPEYYERKEKVNPYVFVKEFSRQATEGAVIVTDTGANIAWTLTAFEVKRNQRIFSAWNHSPMGFAVPGAIGAAFATKQDVYCLIGDGGLMMCLQELATVKRHQLPIKIFVFNNHGHGIQKQTIDTWLNSRYMAVDEPTGLCFPDFEQMGKAFGLTVFTISKHSELAATISQVLAFDGPVLCNVEIVENQRIVPMLKFGAGLEDLDPKIPPKELAAVMAVSK